MKPRYPSFEEKFGTSGAMGTPKHKTRPSHLRRALLCAVLSLSLMLVTVLLLGVSPLLKVSEVCAEDGVRYSADQLLANAGIAPGDPLLGFDASDVEERLMKALPLLADVTVRKHVGGRVTLSVREEGGLYYTQHYQNYYIISADTLRVLTVTSYEDECRQVGAVYVGLPEEVRLRVGRPLSFNYLPYPNEEAMGEISTFEVETAAADKEFSFARDTLSTVMSSSVGRYVTGLELSDRFDLWFVMQGRIKVRLGTADDLNRKLAQAMEVLMKQPSLDVPAVLDASDPTRITYRETPDLVLPGWSHAGMR